MDIDNKLQTSILELLNEAINNLKSQTDKRALSKVLNYLKPQIKLMQENSLSLKSQIAILEKTFDVSINYQSYNSWYKRNIKHFANISNQCQEANNNKHYSNENSGVNNYSSTNNSSNCSNQSSSSLINNKYHTQGQGQRKNQHHQIIEQINHKNKDNQVVDQINNNESIFKTKLLEQLGEI